jgi:hypothetical protein
MSKFMELPTVERYEIVGKLVDAMIYSEEALAILREDIKYFERMGYIKGLMFPAEIEGQVIPPPIQKSISVDNETTY